MKFEKRHEIEREKERKENDDDEEKEDEEDKWEKKDDDDEDKKCGKLAFCFLNDVSYIHPGRGGDNYKKRICREITPTN